MKFPNKKERATIYLRAAKEIFNDERFDNDDVFACNVLKNLDGYNSYDKCEFVEFANIRSGASVPCIAFSMSANKCELTYKELNTARVFALLLSSEMCKSN